MYFPDKPLNLGTFTYSTESLLVGATIATEVPPHPYEDFPQKQIELARIAVADVVAQRVKDTFFPNHPISVVLQPRQFSAVGNSTWIRALYGQWEPEHVMACILEWQRPRSYSGVTYYYSPVSMEPPYSAPSWASRLTEVPMPEINPKYFRWYK